MVGYSLGGASAPTYSSRKPELVTTAVADYPLTAFIQGPADCDKDCCLIDMAHRLAAAAAAGSPPLLALREYEGVSHGLHFAERGAEG